MTRKRPNINADDNDRAFAAGDAARDAAADDSPSSKRGARAEGLAPSRGELKREALDVLALAARLVALGPVLRQRLNLSENLTDQVEQTLRMRAHGARKRQMQFLAKHLREDPDAIVRIRAIVEQTGDAHRQDIAAVHRTERWRDRLLAEGDPALDALIAEHPSLAEERGRLRDLIRQAQREQRAGKPPSAARELFRGLKNLNDASPTAAPE